MYESHFGLGQRPFRAIPDSEHYYPATNHERVLAQLLHALQENEGLALLTGEPGTGKTVLGHCLLDRLGEGVNSVFLTNSHFGDRAGLLQAILYDLALPHERRSEQELRLALTDFLLQNYELGRRTVLVVDEAQHLTADLLEELRLLGNLEGRQGKAVQVILLAQPAILETLRRPELAALRQRLASHARLEPLGLHEAADYLVHHLRAEGGKPEAIVSDEALEALARGARGVPRLLNRAANQALEIACSAGADRVDVEAVLEALERLGLSAGVEPASPAPLEERGEEQLEPEDPRDGRPLLTVETPADPAPRGPADLPGDASRARRLFASPRRPA